MSSTLSDRPFVANSEGRPTGSACRGTNAPTWKNVGAVLRARSGEWFTVVEVAQVLDANKYDTAQLLRLMAKAGEIVVKREQITNFYRV